MSKSKPVKDRDTPCDAQSDRSKVQEELTPLKPPINHGERARIMELKARLMQKSTLQPVAKKAATIEEEKKNEVMDSQVSVSSPAQTLKKKAKLGCGTPKGPIKGLGGGSGTKGRFKTPTKKS